MSGSVEDKITTTKEALTDEAEVIAVTSNMLHADEVVAMNCWHVWDYVCMSGLCVTIQMNGENQIYGK